MKKKVLIVVAHPDDEAIGCGGYISKLVSLGNTVYGVYLTDGEKGRSDSSPKKILSRKKEAYTSSKILGLKWIDQFCGIFEDQLLDIVPLIKINKILEKVKKLVNPDIIITHFNWLCSFKRQVFFRK